METEQKIRILLRALEAAPYPMEGDLDSLHPEDAQRWIDRYCLWYKEVRSTALSLYLKSPKNNVYYQIDRLVQEANSLKQLIADKPQVNEKGPPPVDTEPQEDKPDEDPKEEFPEDDPRKDVIVPDKSPSQGVAMTIKKKA